jgi:nicotinamide-nucleotide adenylyltransferase
LGPQPRWVRESWLRHGCQARRKICGVSPGEISPLLSRLEASDAPAVARFDDGAALCGRVAVLPSAFNPPTVAHLHLLDIARSVERVDVAAALLSTRNVGKGIFGAGLADRVGMLLAARADSPQMAVLAVNAARLVDQAEVLRSAFPEAAFDFVVGYDTLIRLFDPVYYEDMPAQLEGFFLHHRVIATNRGKDAIGVVREFVQTSTAPFAERIVVREIDERPASLSSTAAREEAASGNAAIVPPGVARYIKERGLYR